MTIIRNATAAFAWFWGCFVLLSEGLPGFVRMAHGLGYTDASQILLAMFYTAVGAITGAILLWAKGAQQ